MRWGRAPGARPLSVFGRAVLAFLPRRPPLPASEAAIALRQNPGGPIVNDERKSSPATRPLDCGKICGLTQRCRTDAALAVLVAIMEDETAALCSRIAAANSVLAWANVEWVAMDPAVGGRGEQRQS